MIQIRHATSIGLSEEQCCPLLNLPELNSAVAQMRNALHMALAFSPLLALIPKKLASDGVRRDHLLAVCFVYPAMGFSCLISISMPFL
jgi:hypothetical protein